MANDTPPGRKRVTPKRKAKGRRKPPAASASSVKNSWTSPKQIRLQRRRALALGYREAGWTFERIGKAMGCSLSVAHSYVSTALKQIPFEAASEVLRLELRRLDEYMAAQHPGAVAGDVVATNTALRIMRRRAALLGLDAENRNGVSVPALLDQKPQPQVSVVFVVPGHHEVEADVEVERPIPGQKLLEPPRPMVRDAFGVGGRSDRRNEPRTFDETYDTREVPINQGFLSSLKT